MIDAVVLAAGISSRMQDSNKLLMPYKGSTIVQNVVEAILASDASKVVVVLGHQHSEILCALDHYPVEFIFNAAYHRGQTASIQASISQLEESSSGFMVCLGDMPLIKKQDYNKVIDFFIHKKKTDDRPIVRPVFKNSTGHPVLFDTWYKSAILEHDQPDGCKRLIAAYNEHFHPLNVSTLQYFFDIDNPDDYRRLIISSDSH